ncbi:MAG: S41 family peptidase [Alphaproteobacteria bacterium]
MLDHLWRCAAVLALMLLTLPAGAAGNADGVAVVIGNQHYRGEIPEAAQAAHDAAAVRDYLLRVRGFDAANLIELADASRGDIAALFLPGGPVERLVRPGDSDLVVYFSGHGIPGDDAGAALLGVNGDGYPLATLMRRLADLPARRVTVLLEAGFSGISHAGPVREPASPTALPYQVPDHITLLAAADAGQVAGWAQTPGGGLFTAAVLAALSGDADAEGDKDGRTTLGEVEAYLSDSLPATAMRITRRQQHAVLRGADDWVLAGGKSPALAVADGEARVLTNASLRDRPTTRSDRLEVLAPGAFLQLLAQGRDRNWLKVRWRDVEGYVFAPLVARGGEPEARPPVPGQAPRTATAKPASAPAPVVMESEQGEMLLLDDLALRAGPGDNDAVIEELRAGIRLRVTGTVMNGARLRVQLASGLVGFLPVEVLTPAPASDLPVEQALDRIRAGLGQGGSTTAVRAAAELDDKLIVEVHDRVLSDFVHTLAPGQLVDAIAVGLYRAARTDADQFDGARLTRAAIDGIIDSLDRHSGYLDPKQYRDMQVQVRGEFAGLGIEVTMENDKVKVISPIDHTPAARAGLRAGDLVSHLDGEPVAGMTLPQAVARMRGLVGTAITLTVERKDQAPFDVTIVRDVVRIQAVRWQVRDDIGYIRITTFNENVDDDVREAIAAIRDELGAGFRGLILDLRNNPGGLLKQAVSVSDVFLDKGEIVSLKGRAPADSWRYRATSGDEIGGRPVLVLINNGSASASEIVASALQDQRRAVVAGVTSYGKGSVQTIMPLRNSGALRLTTALYYRPSGSNFDGAGVHPDVELDTEGLELPDVIDRARRLLVLQAANPAPPDDRPARE